MISTMTNFGLRLLCEECGLNPDFVGLQNYSMTHERYTAARLIKQVARQGFIHHLKARLEEEPCESVAEFNAVVEEALNNVFPAWSE